MENDTTISKEGLLEPVFPGSVTFESSILAPLRSSYLYEESKESFTYNSAQLIINPVLQKRYSAFCAEKRSQGYSEEELQESFGFLLLDDKSRANRLAETGLIVGQGTCTTLGDCLKGVYISKYSDCLDLKRWYDGKTGYIILLKLTKGRVKEVSENYTQNFTRPTAGFDCHVSEQLRAVCATTSSFLAFERTQYYMYELLDGGENVEPCPRHVCPFAIVAFSYGKTAISLELKEKSQEKSTFYYQPWSGQLKIESTLYSIGLKSIHGAMFPASLPKTVNVDHAIGGSELRKTLPQAVFENSPLGEVLLDGKWFSMYDVISNDTGNDLARLTQELKEKDMALVVCLEDGGFLVVLHSSNFLSYEGAGTDKAFALQGMFIYPDSRTVPRETKSGYCKTTVSSEVLQVLPALNYAESEMEKCPPKQHEEPLGIMEKHLQNFAALILPGLTSSPSREASMFPDQYDVPDGFPVVAPKWTELTRDRLESYLKSPHSFQIPVARALELLAAGKQQRSDDQEDDVYYYISSPEAPQTPAGMVLERDLPNDRDHLTCVNVSDNGKKTDEQQAEPKKTVAAEVTHCAMKQEVNTPGAAVVAAPDNNPGESTNPSLTSGDLPTEHYTQKIDAVSAAQDSEKTTKSVSAEDKCSEGEISSKETIQTPSVALSSAKVGDDTSTEMEVDQSQKIDCLSDVLPKVGGQIPVADKGIQEADLPTSISPPTTSVNRTEALIKDCKEMQPEAVSNDVAEKPLPNRRGRRRKRKSLKRNTKTVGAVETPLQNTTLSIYPSTEATPQQSSTVNSDATDSTPSTQKKDWRSLPRRKRHWSTDVRVKRTLRSDFKNHDMADGKNSEMERNASILELAVNVMPSTPKQKREGVNMRERYGLKTIITDCGKVFVPHGSDVAPGDIKSNENEQAQETSVVTTSNTMGENLINTPTLDEAQTSQLENRGPHMPLNHIQNISVTPAKALTSGDVTEKDPVSPKTSEQSAVLESSTKHKSTVKGHVYRAISISKLKTVLKRAKRTKSPSAQDLGNSTSGNAEPELKRGKLSKDVEMSDKSSTLEHNPQSTGSQEPAENTPSKPHLKTTLYQEMQISKIPQENGCNNFDSFSPNEVVKQASQQLDTRVKGKSISDGKSKKEEVAVSVATQSDALNLLADLALSVNSDKMLSKMGEKHTGAKTSRSHQKVMHLLRDLNPRLNLPAKSPFPVGLTVTGELVFEISKEHSYSQPTSLLSGLTGTCPKVQPPVGRVESRLSMKSDPLQKLPDPTSCPSTTNKESKNGWALMTSVSASSPAAAKAKVWSSDFLRCRTIIEKEGSIQVTRNWKENYDFKFDSKFTNDKLDKCVSRALHGKWDFSVKDNYEQVHLIFHMWIGLFYSKPTSRFFHFDQTHATAERKNPEKGLLCAVPTSTPAPDVDLTSNEDTPIPLDPVTDALDLSVKEPGDLDDFNKNLTPSSGVRSRPEDTRENKDSLDHSPAVLVGGFPMDYRSTVEALDENAASSFNDSSDMENDPTDISEGSYSKHLESNSAYTQLCDHASNLRIAEQKLLNMQKNEVLNTDLSTPNIVNKKSARMMGTDTKNMGVFHQVVGAVRPVILSKVHDFFHERKILLKSLSLKDKHKNQGSILVHSERVSRDQKIAAAVNEERHESTPVCVHSGTTIVCPLKAKRGLSVPACDKNATRIIVKSVLPIRTETPVVVHDLNKGTQEKSASGQREDEVMNNDIGDTPMGALDVSNKTRQEVESVKDDTLGKVRNDDVLAETRVTDEATEKVGPVADVGEKNPIDMPNVSHETKEQGKPPSHVLSDAPKEVLVDDETKDKVTPVSVRDDSSINVSDVIKSKEVATPVRVSTSSHDVRNDTRINDETTKAATLPVGTSVHEGENAPRGACDENDDASDEVVNIRETSVDELGVVDDIPVNEQDVSDTSKEAKPDVTADISADVQDVSKINKEPGLAVRDDTPANIQGVHIGAKDETKCQSDVRDCSSVDRPHDVEKTEDMAVHKEMFAMEEHVSEKDESNTDDVTNERKVEEPICDADIESDSEAQNTIDESQDLIECVDMEISDKDSEDENQENEQVLNVSGGESPLKAFEEDTEMLKEGEIPDETPVSSDLEEHTSRDVAPSGLPDCSSAGHVTSTTPLFSMLKEDHGSSPAVGGTCSPTQSVSESKTFPGAIVVQPQTPEDNRYKPGKVCDVLLSAGIVKPEPYEIKDSCMQDTVEAADLVADADVGSGKDPRKPKKSSDRKLLVPIVRERSADSIDASPPALQIDSDAEINSRSCTPTLDEPAYSQGVVEDSDVQEVNLQDAYETEPYSLKSSKTNTWLVLDSSDDSHSELETSPGHREQILSESSSQKKYSAIVEETDEIKPFLANEHVPEDDLFYLDCKAIPADSSNTEEIQPHGDHFGSFSEQYEDEHYEELPSSWGHSTSFKTEGQKDLDEWYAPDEDRHHTNSFSVHRGVRYRPREITESNSDMSGWGQRLHYSESSPGADVSNERTLSFRGRAGLSEFNDDSESHESEPARYSKKKRKRKSCQNKWDEDYFNTTVDYSIQKTISCSPDQSSISRTRTSTPYQHKEDQKQLFDWRRYFRREGIFESNEGDNLPPSIITTFDKKGNRVIFESPSTAQKQLSDTHGVNQSKEEQQTNFETQSLMEHELLIFSEKMSHLLKNCKTASKANPKHRPNISLAENPMTIQFSILDEQSSFSALDQTWPTLSKLKINVDMSERKALKKTSSYSKPLHLQSLFYERGTEASCSKLSDITKECLKSYHTMMNDICTGKAVAHQNDELKKKWDIEQAKTSKQTGFCGRIKKDMFDHLHNNLNSVVRQACKTKYKFYIFATSTDPFFEETKHLLEAEGHTAVEPYQFDFDSNSQTPLLIILKNEDIAEHIFEVPHLLELKKSSRVLFMGIDQPDDVVNLTHQELFAKGGFVVFDETALDTLSLENMKKVVGIMEELDKKGKWKWFLHYRDSRKLRENSRCSPEAQRRKQFIDCCQEAGIVEVLHYHDCDVISRDRPNYLRCLICLQIQNISARFPVFITDIPDDTYEKNGILTMNIKTFSRILSNDTCLVS